MCEGRQEAPWRQGRGDALYDSKLWLLGTFAARKDDSLRSIDDAMARPDVTRPVQGDACDDARGRPAFPNISAP